MDEADRSDEVESRLLQMRIQAVSSKPINTSNPSGHCLWCEEPTGIERRFCGPECRDDWSKEYD